MKASIRYWLFVLLLILGDQLSAQEKSDSLFAPFVVHIDIDKESFLIGTLDDYRGHKQSFTVGRDSASFLIKPLKEFNPDILQQFMENADGTYQFVDHYYPEEKNLALWIQSLFSSEFPDLQLTDNECEGRCIRLQSASLSEIINSYYDYDSASGTSVFLDTIYSGRLKPEKFQTFRQKLSFLAGAFLRSGYQTEADGYYLSMPNSTSKAKLCSSLLKEFDCENVTYEIFLDYIPVGHRVCFEPSETIGKLVEWVIAVREYLK
jgi:hypothetical protein